MTHYEPTEDEIRQRAAEIQARWSEAEEEKRRVSGREQPYEIGQVKEPRFITKAIGLT